jgi:2-methylcitrate dehydratase PrpD
MGFAKATALRRETVIDYLADFAHAVALPRVPADVQTQARLSILDTLGCILAGSRTSEARMVLAAEKALGSGPCLVFGSDVSLRAQEAARCNSYFGDIFELNDLTGGHAGIANVTAMLANAQEVGATSDELLGATVAGIEVTTRIYNALYPTLKPYSECGVGMIGLANTVGVAAGSARLLKLDAAQTRGALEIAAALAGWCPAEAIFGPGSTLKPVLFGSWPASVGLLAARYAAAGMTGPKEILEGRMGFARTVAHEFDLGAIETKAWALSRPRRKHHACCGYIHSALDMVARQHARNPVALENARAMHLRIAPYVMRAMGRSAPPRTSNEARFHAQYCLALAGTGRGTILPEHSEQFSKYFQADDVRNMYDRITLEADETLTHYHHSSLSIECADGSLIHDMNTTPKGSPDNPMTEQEVVAKFRSLAERVVGGDRAEQVVSLVGQLSGERPLDELWTALA